MIGLNALFGPPAPKGPRRPLTVLDVFCGAGGGTDATREAAEMANYSATFTLVNHWDVACATAKANFPAARVLCTGVENIIAQHLYMRGRLDVLQGGPECIEFSRAAGKKPKNYQYRPTPWCMLRFAEALLPRIVLIENVAEFEKKWPPFKAWIAAFKSLGYTCEWRVFNAADYGDPTTRERLFMLFVRRPLKNIWADPTHSEEGGEGRAPWLDAEKHVIDWTKKGRWLDEMKGQNRYGGLPLSPKTLERVYDGLRRSGVEPLIVTFDNQSSRPGARSAKKPISTVTGKARHAVAEPFFVSLRGTGKSRSVKRPAPTVTAGGMNLAVCEPSLIHTAHGGKRKSRSVKQPMPTIAGNRGDMALIEPFIVPKNSGEKRVRSVKRPLHTVTGNSRSEVLVEPFIMPKLGRFGMNKAQSVKRPMGTVIGDGRVHLVQPFIVPGQGDRKGQRPRTHSLKSPAPTITGSGHMHLVEPSLLPQHGGGVMRSVKKPVATIATDGVIHLVEAFLVKYYGTGKSASIKKPLPTVTTKDRFALCCPVVIRDGKMARVRIRWRILEPAELAAAQGFRKDYKFFGARRRNGKVLSIEHNANKGDIVKQIGNAWPHHLARALMLAALTQTRDIRPYLREWNRRAA